MRHWWQLGTRNWRVRPGRAVAAVLSVALGVATVVIVTAFYETARRAVTDEVVANWVGTAHLSVEPPGAHWGELDLSLMEPISELPNVKQVTARFKHRMYLVHDAHPEQFVDEDRRQIDAVGIIPEMERHFRSLPGLTGRMFKTGERGVAVMEKSVAEDWGVKLGDKIPIAPYRRSDWQSFKVIGLFESQRLAEFQKPTIYLPITDVQELLNKKGTGSIIEVMLEDPSREKLTAACQAVTQLIHERGLPYKVHSARARQDLLNEAERVTRMLLVLTAFISMMTAFFIILTTMSMSLIQRRPVLGIMRCVGVTRFQLAGLLLLELFPLGILGTILGIGLGYWGAGYIADLPDVMVRRVYFSSWGNWLAVGSGLATTMLCTLALLLIVCRVGPLEAVNIESRPAKTVYVVGAGVIGLMLIGVHEWMRLGADAFAWFTPFYVFAGTFSLYTGYVLIAPGLVLLVGRPVARAVGNALGLNGKLAEDQFGRAPWRSGGVCWMLLVGLSLIVFMAVRLESVYSVWAFPKHLPETFVWSPEYVTSDVIERVKSLPGVGKTTVVTDVDCTIVSTSSESGEAGGDSRRSLWEKLLRQMTRPVFVVGDVDEIFSLMKVGFAEGNLQDAKARLKQGGYVIIPTFASQYHDLHLGDRIRIRILDREAEFTVAAVVQSPALDIAANFFHAQSYMQFASASALLGTREDLKEKFGLDLVSMFMSNLELPETPVPEEFQRDRRMDTTDEANMVERALRWSNALPTQRDILEPILPELKAHQEHGDPLSEKAREELKRMARAVDYAGWHWGRRTPELRWAVFRERLVLTRIAREMNRPDAIIGSITRLVEAVDKSIRRSAVILTWMPSVALVVAAIGIGNLMMLSVHARTRQIAILRAVGAMRSQILRMVLAEAITLGLLGSILGLGLGLHQAHSEDYLVGELSGVYAGVVIPFGTILLSIGFTVLICVLAGLGPARYAARSNIISAIQTT
jgi:ABC-type lipoprotein release transport system permease subunit